MDWIQLLVGAGCVFVLLWWPLHGFAGQKPWISSLSHLPESASLLLMLQGFVLSITTQFYNPYNWHTGSVVPHPSVTGSFAQRESDLVWKWGAILTAILLTGLAAAGILIGSRQFPAPTFAVVESIASGGPAWGKFLVVAGLLSLTTSTVDGLMIALVANWYQSFVRRGFRRNDGEFPGDDQTGRRELAGVRRMLVLLYFAGFVVLVPCYFLALPQQVVTILLLMGSGVSVLFPLLVLAVWLYRTGRLQELTNGAIVTFVGLFWSSWLTSLIALGLAPAWVDTIPLVFMAVAGVIALAMGGGGFRAGTGRVEPSGPGSRGG